MGSSKFNEPGVGSAIVADKVGGAAIFGYREVPVDAWSSIAFAGVASPGTPEQQGSQACKGLWVVNSPYSQNPVAVGPSSSVRATASAAAWRGMPVYPGAAIFFPVSNANLLYIDNLAGDKFGLFFLTHTDS